MIITNYLITLGKISPLHIQIFRFQEFWTTGYDVLQSAFGIDILEDL